MINTTRLRKFTGWLGGSLSIIVLVLSIVYGYSFPDSISGTYYVPTCIAPFMIILGASSVLLMTYSGYDKVDDVLNTLAGIFGLGICLFPCAVAGLSHVGTFQLPVGISNTVHVISAVCFLGLLAYNSLFQFTKGAAIPTVNKKKRNVIFRVCGIGMIASFILLPLTAFGIINVPHVTWVVEAIALAFFGVSWLTKANCYKVLFKD